MSFFRSICKWQKSVKTVKEIVPSLKQTMQMVRSGHSLSVASSRQRQVQEERNQINRRAREEEALIDEEERNLEEQEAANNAILAAKTRSRRTTVRQEWDNRRFEVGAARSESLARIEDEITNDMGSAHGLDAVSIGNWVNGTHDNRGPEGDNITPFVTSPSTSQPASGPDLTKVTEPVMTNVDPCTRPSVTTTLVAAKLNPLYSIARRIMVPTSLGWQHQVERIFVRRPGFWKTLA
jgi:hypothetical protein